jgi:hydroxymethylbilane synthase
MSDVDVLVLGTRGSQLALAQSGQVGQTIASLTGVRVELRVIRTRGDQVQDRPLAAIGGKGLFTAELEEALREGSIDFAVHSLKDLPTEDAEGLCLGAFPLRADPRDALVGARLEALRSGAVVGTGSLRRRTQLQALRPDLELRDIRGNVDTRLAKRDRGDYDAVVLAVAGLGRLGIQRPDIVPLETDQVLPAVGQGILGLQCRTNDARVLGLLASVDHADSRAVALAERAFLAAYGGGCDVPVACHVRRVGAILHGEAAGPQGQGVRRVRLEGADPVALGQELARLLRA